MKCYPLIETMQNEKLFDYESADDVIQQLNSLPVPFKHAYKSALGGQGRTSILFSFSLDPKQDWANGIFENSRYIKMHISNSGIVEQISSSHKLTKRFRKFTAKSIDKLLSGLKKYINEIS